MRNKFILVAILGILCVLPTVTGLQLKVHFVEKGKIISYYDDYFVTNVNGTAYVVNPSNTTIYNVIIPFSIQPMTLIELTDTGYVDQNQIRINELGPLANLSFGYKLVGIPLRNPMDGTRGVLHSAMIRYMVAAYGQEGARIYSQLMGKLMKSNVENMSHPGLNTRLVTVYLENPTAFYYNISSVKVIKTSGMDPNPNVASGWMDQWNFPNVQYPKTVMQPFEIYNIDILDFNASEGEVYWLSSDIFIPEVAITGTHNVTLLTQDDVLVIEGEIVQTLENGTNVSLLEQPMFIQKKISQAIVNPGDKVTVEVRVTNLGFETQSVFIKDAFPYGFSLTESMENVSGRNISFYRRVAPKTPLLLKYTLSYDDSEALGLDYFPAAELYWKNETFYSQTIPFVRRYIPEKVLYVQKSLKYSLNDEIVVKIDVTNFGQAAIENVVLKEYLASEHVFREISRQPYAKGVWQIPVIESGETWTVTYVTNEHTNLNLLPEIFGVSSNYIMKSLLMENVIRSRFTLSGTKFIEFVGIALLISLPLLYFFVNKRYAGRKVRHVDAVSSKIHDLKHATQGRPQEKIDRILRESRPKHHQPSRAYPGETFEKRDHALPEERIGELSEDIDRMRDRSK